DAEDLLDPLYITARSLQTAGRGDDRHPHRRVGRGPRELPRL
ncbi:MAG: hypothetical protein AVDCRST_MAG14-559, partial [uncultured Rubrobacteraceae bacterium]